MTRITMKYILNLLVLFSILEFFTACSNHESADSEKAKTFAYSGNYKPHEFENDNRGEKIEGLASRFHKLIEKRAEDRHIPGITYGIVVGDELVLASSTGFINLEDSLPATTASVMPRPTLNGRVDRSRCSNWPRPRRSPV